MAFESLKEYLVKVGFNVDELGLNNTSKLITNLDKKVGNMGSGIVSNFANGAKAVLSFSIMVNKALAKIAYNTSMADLSVERFARKMWTTEQNARSFMNALEAMDASYEDIFYMTPEEYKNMLNLRNLGQSLEAPKEVEKTLRTVRDINHEINKFKVTLNYAQRWIMYFVGKYMGKELDALKKKLQGINEYLIKIMPKVASAIAKFFTWNYRLFKTIVSVFERAMHLAKAFFDSIDKGFSKAGVAIMAFIGLLAVNPFVAIIAGLIYLLLLLEDYQTWERGGKSVYGDRWQGLSKKFKEIEKAVEDANLSFGDLISSALRLFGIIGDVIGKIVEFLIKIGALDAALYILKGTMDGVAEVLQLISDLLSIITGNIDKISKNGIINKIIKKNEDGSINPGGTAKGYAGAIIDRDSIINKILRFFKDPVNGSMSIFGDMFNDFVNKNNGSTQASTSAARTTTGSSNITKTSKQTVVNNNMDMKVYQGNNSNTSTARDLGLQILKQTNVTNPLGV